MRLHYLRGDRPAALRAYQRCRETLRREFGVDPLPETARLAREIDLGTVPVPATPRPRAELPLSVLRPRIWWDGSASGRNWTRPGNAAR